MTHLWTPGSKISTPSVLVDHLLVLWHMIALFSQTLLNSGTNCQLKCQLLHPSLYLRKLFEATYLILFNLNILLIVFNFFPLLVGTLSISFCYWYNLAFAKFSYKKNNIFYGVLTSRLPQICQLLRIASLYTAGGCDTLTNTTLANGTHLGTHLGSKHRCLEPECVPWLPFVLSISEFKPDAESVKAYLERMKLFLLAK